VEDFLLRADVVRENLALVVFEVNGAHDEVGEVEGWVDGEGPLEEPMAPTADGVTGRKKCTREMGWSVWKTAPLQSVAKLERRRGVHRSTVTALFITVLHCAIEEF
jgi:hypothetical protein